MAQRTHRSLQIEAIFRNKDNSLVTYMATMEVPDAETAMRILREKALKENRILVSSRFKSTTEDVSFRPASVGRLENPDLVEMPCMYKITEDSP